MRIVCLLVSVSLAVPAFAQSFNGRSATEWVQDLAAEDPTMRDYAMWALVTMGDRAVCATTRALGDERPRVRQHAALALGRIGVSAASATERLVACSRTRHRRSPRPPRSRRCASRSTRRGCRS